MTIITVENEEYFQERDIMYEIAKENIKGR